MTRCPVCGLPIYLGTDGKSSYVGYAGEPLCAACFWWLTSFLRWNLTRSASPSA